MASKAIVLRMARPGRGRAGEAKARPGEAPISPKLDCDLQSKVDRGLGNYETLKRVHEALPAHPLKDFLARVLGRKFFQVISSNRTQQKHWKGLCPNITQLQAQQKHCKNTSTTKLYLAFTSSYVSSNAKNNNQIVTNPRIQPW